MDLEEAGSRSQSVRLFSRRPAEKAFDFSGRIRSAFLSLPLDDDSNRGLFARESKIIFRLDLKTGPKRDGCAQCLHSLFCVW
jgi:hypothetical protein